MKKILFLLLIGWVALSACAGAAATPSINDDFHPTDPKTVNLAAGKPQFVEFFAFW